jgi:1-carboxybiuret hydrolase subunit AtzG-like protein
MPNKGTTATLEETADYITRTALSIGLRVRPEHMAGVIENTIRLRGQAQLFAEFALPEDVEACGIFQP